MTTVAHGKLRPVGARVVVVDPPAIEEKGDLILPEGVIQARRKQVIAVGDMHPWAPSNLCEPGDIIWIGMDCGTEIPVRGEKQIVVDVECILAVESDEAADGFETGPTTPPVERRR